VVIQEPVVQPKPVVQEVKVEEILVKEPERHDEKIEDIKVVEVLHE